MLIDCPSCAASYHITKAALEPNGRRVACPRCETVWLAKPAVPEAESAFSADIHLSPDDRPASTKHADYARTVSAAPAPARPFRMPAFLHHVCTGAALLALAMGLIAARDTVARAWPGAGRLYAAMGMPVAGRSLAIRDLHTALMHLNGEAYLGVEGVIVNLRPEETPVPPVRLAIRDADGHDLYTWTVAAGRHALSGGESLLFRARLAEPPPDGRDVVARFDPAETAIAAR